MLSACPCVTVRTWRRESLLGMLPCADVHTLIQQYMEDFPAALAPELQEVGAEVGARL